LRLPRLAAPSRKFAGRDGEALAQPALRQGETGFAAAWWAWGLLTTAPLIAAGGLIMSPDAILLPLWLGVMLSVVRAFKASSDAKALCWGRWLLIGALIGLGGLAKYSAAAFYPLLGVFLLVFKREWLLRPQIWVSGLVALAFQLPVLIWNMQNDWVGLTHVLWQAGGAGDERHGGLATLGEYVGGQALVLGPVVFGFVVWALTRCLKREDLATRWLVWVAVAILAAFAVLSLTTKVQANWPVLGSVVALIVLAVWLGKVEYLGGQGRGKHWWVLWVVGFGIVLNSVLSVMLMDTYRARYAGLLPLKPKNDPTKDLRGWQDMGAMLGLMLYKLDNPLVLSSRYQTLAPLMFHTLGNPEFAYRNAEDKRLNEYDLWPQPELKGRLVVYVSEKAVLPEKVKVLFTTCAPWHALGVEEYGVEVRRLNMWICWGAR
jgi:Dolichyl-phosphate-mannose-protein mannosyltransferase